MIEPTDTIGDDVRLYRGDCLAVLPTLAPVDAVVTDPPYGMDWNTRTDRFSGGHNPDQRGPGRHDGMPVAGDDKPFDPSPWLPFRKVILWGSNHFASRLPVGTTLVWVKRNDAGYGSFLSDAEVAWMKGGHGVYLHRDLSMNVCTQERQHPTQKPLGLMRWCIERLKLQPGATILDPFMGSGTTGVAAMGMGFKFIGIELDPTHYATALRRLTHATGAGPGQLFGAAATA